MTTFTESHARLANDVYEDGTLLKDTPFTIISTIDKPSGYHGVIYRNEITRELVVSHRGTEFDGDKIRDLAVTDAQMALLKVNQQLDGAREAVELALALAKKNGDRVTVTGHSLGGTLAQITAYEYGLEGETFNAYGAVGLYGVPKGGDQVINYVRATDMVGAANAHFGKVQVYALQADVHALLVNEALPSQQSRIELLKDISQLSPGKTHGVVQFHGGTRSMEDESVYGRNSIINPDAQALYEKHKYEFDAYRQDIEQTAHVLGAGVMLTGVGLAYAANISQQHVLNKVVDALGHNEEIHDLRIEEQNAILARNRNFQLPAEPLIYRPDPQQNGPAGPVRQIQRAMDSYRAPKEEISPSTPPQAKLPVDIRKSDHPGHREYMEILSRVGAFEAQNRIQSGAYSERLAASIVVLVVQEKLDPRRVFVVENERGQIEIAQRPRHGEPAGSEIRIAINAGEMASRAIEQSSLRVAQAISPHYVCQAPAAERTREQIHALSELSPQDRALFDRIRQELPAHISDDKVAQAMLAATQSDMDCPGKIERIVMTGESLFIMGTIHAGLSHAKLSLAEQAPPLRDTVQQAQGFNHQQEHQLASLAMQRGQDDQSRIGSRMI